MDPRPEPQLKVEELGKKLDHLALQHRPSDFDLAAVRRESETLVKKAIAPAMGHVLLGIVCALSLDRDGFLYHFRVAKDLSAERHIRALYAAHARRVGLYKIAVDQVAELFRNYPDDVSVVKLAREIATTALDFDLFFRTRIALEKLGIKEEDVIAKFAPKYRRTFDLCKTLGVTSEQLSVRLEAAATVVFEHGEPIFDTLYDHTPDGQFSYVFGVKCDINRVTEINFAIVDRIVEQFDETLAEVMTFACLPARRELLPSRLPSASAATPL